MQSHKKHLSDSIFGPEFLCMKFTNSINYGIILQTGQGGHTCTFLHTRLFLISFKMSAYALGGVYSAHVTHRPYSSTQSLL